MTQSDYEQKKRKCWVEFCKDNGIDQEVNISIFDAFNQIFDRAYALGKQKETITQEEIEKAAEEYAVQKTEQYIPESYGDMRHRRIAERFDSHDMGQAFEDGVNFALGKQEKDADAVIQGWVAADDDGDLFLYRTKPARDEVSGMWMSNECPLDVGINLFPDLTWDSDPEPVEIIIKRKNK